MPDSAKSPSTRRSSPLRLGGTWASGVPSSAEITQSAHASPRTSQLAQFTINVFMGHRLPPPSDSFCQRVALASGA